MKKKIFVFISLILVGCTSAAIEPVLVDSFFSGQALLDTNGNQQIDAEDSPLEHATFIVTLPGGTEFGGDTDASGSAFVTVPAAVDYPITVRMEAPEGSELILLEPSEIVLSEATGETIKFLFKSK